MTALAVALMGGATSCSDDDASDLPPPASPPAGAPTPSTALDPEDAHAAAEIQAAFDDYMQALIDLSTAGVPGGTEETEARLEEVHVSSDAYFALADDLLTENFLAGRATSGTITWDAEVLEIDWENTFRANPDHPVPLATLRVCFDETGWTTIDVETDEVVAGPGERYLSTVIVTWRDEDPDRPEREPRWQVSSREDGNGSC